MPKADEEAPLLANDGLVKKVLGFNPLFLTFWATGVVVWLAVGVLAAVYFEGWSVLTAFYVITQIVTTIGYGDITVDTQGAKLFMGFYTVGTLLLIATMLTDMIGNMVTSNENYLRKQLRRFEAHASKNIKNEEDAKSALGSYNELGASSFLFFIAVLFGTCFYATFEACSCSYGVTKAAGCIEGPECPATGGYTKTWVDSFYMSLITLTTVGFGDHSPKSDIGRMVGIVWMLVGVVVTGNMLSKFSATLDGNSKEKARLNTMTDEIFRRIDMNNDGVVNLNEFRCYALVKFGIITNDELADIDRMFKTIDKDGSGKLTLEEIKDYCDETPSK